MSASPSLRRRNAIDQISPSTVNTMALFVMGHPLLDIQVSNADHLLSKYDLKADDAILVQEKQVPIYDEIIKNYKVTYVAGGAAQNAARGAAYVLPPNSVVYTGCVGDDELADKLREANQREGLQSAYFVKKGSKTGRCAVIITGHNRSLVTDLQAAEKFDISHISSEALAPLIDAAKVFYVEGFFLTHGTDIVVELAMKASVAGKTFAINISAPFIAQFFGQQLLRVLPYCDFVFGNNEEATVWASATGQENTTDIPAIARAIAALPKANGSRPRVVVITHGAHPTILVSSNDTGKVQTFEVTPIPKEEIVDTNAAGDAFAGGFMGAYVAGKGFDEAVLIGHKLAAMCVKQIGSQYEWPKVKVL